MVLKIYGNRFSYSTRLVAVVCDEYKVPYELINLNLFFKDHKSEAYLKVQPFGLVPYINDDGFILYESRAIARYIASKYRGNVSTPLFPDVARNLPEYAKFEQAASVEAASWDQYAAVVATELVYKPSRGFGGDPEYADKHLQVLHATLDVYEKILANQKYIAGDELTLADFFHLPYGSLLTSHSIVNLVDVSRRPNVARWWQDISSRQSWKTVTVEVPDVWPAA